MGDKVNVSEPPLMGRDGRRLVQLIWATAADGETVTESYGAVTYTGQAAVNQGVLQLLSKFEPIRTFEQFQPAQLGGGLTQAPDIILAPSDGHDKGMANIVLTGTNDQVGINDAIDSLGAEGGWIHIMAGTVTLGGAISIAGGDNRLRITGAGRGGHVLGSLWGDQGATRITGSGAFDMFSLNNHANVTLQHLDLFGNGGAITGHGIAIPIGSFVDLTLLDCNVNYFGGTGVDSARGAGVMVIDGCLIAENGESGVDCSETSIYMSNTYVVANTNNGVRANNGPNPRTFIGCNISENGDDGFSSFGGTGATEGITVIGCQINDNGSEGIRWPGNATGADWSIIVGNQIRDNGSTGVIVGPESIVMGNVIDGNSPDTVTAGTGSVVTANVPENATDTAQMVADFVASTPLVWTDMPAALTELFGSTMRKQLDLTQYSEVRLSVTRGAAASVAGAELRGQYSTNSGAAWSYFDGTSQPLVGINVTSQVASSGWITMAGASQADVQVRVAGINGDGAADPDFTQVSLEFR